MKFLVTWIVIILMAAAGVVLQYLPWEGRLIIVHLFGFMLLMICFLFVPMWISGSCWFVKMAIECAQHNDWKRVRFLLVSRGPFIYPSPRYAEIVRLLRELCADPEKKPKQESIEFDQYITYDGFRYSLIPDGREKMINKVNAGWINGAYFENPKYLQILLRVAVVIAVIRAIILFINIFHDNH